MKINIFGSTGLIDTKSLAIIKKHFPKIKVNLLCANNNYKLLIKQTQIYKPKYIFINNEKYILYLKKNIPKNTKILYKNEISNYLFESVSEFTILATIRSPLPSFDVRSSECDEKSLPKTSDAGSIPS